MRIKLSLSVSSNSAWRDGSLKGSCYVYDGTGRRTGCEKTHNLFVDDLKVYQENHQKLEVVNEIIVKASMDTGACYGVKKCAEIVFKKGKMV